MGSRRTLARDFGVLLGGLAIVLWTAAALFTDLELESARVLAVLASIAATGAALGLFLAWGDEGDRLLNATRNLLVLLGFVVAVVTLLAWAASPGT